MGQLLVRKVDDDLILALKRRAAEHGVSVEEWHRRLLARALEFGEKPSASAVFPTSVKPAPGLKEPFTRLADSPALQYEHDLLREGEDFKAHLLDLGEAGPDLDLERPRAYSKRRDIEL